MTNLGSLRAKFCALAWLYEMNTSNMQYTTFLRGVGKHNSNFHDLYFGTPLNKELLF